jgi:hypothetical protein
MNDAFPLRILDAGHRMLGAFDDAETAHRFAHEACRQPGAHLPVEVFDVPDRSSRFVWPDRCEAVRWMAVERTERCGASDLPGPPGAAAAGVR